MLVTKKYAGDGLYELVFEIEDGGRVFCDRRTIHRLQPVNYTYYKLNLVRYIERFNRRLKDVK